MYERLTMRCCWGLLALLMLACSTTEPDPPDPFGLEIVVRREDGSAVPGLGVAVIPDLLGADETEQFLARRAAARVIFTLTQPVLCSVRVYDAAAEPVAVLIDRKLRVAGIHSIDFVEDTAGGGHLSAAPRRFELVLEDPTTNEEVHRSSRWGVRFLGPDLDRCTLGFTDAQGRLVLADPRIAPGSFDLPAFENVDENGDVVGSFALSDSVTVIVHDPLDGRRVTARLALGTHSHRLDLQWDGVPGAPRTQAAGVVATKLDVPPPDTSTRLHPITPNPYN